MKRLPGYVKAVAGTSLMATMGVIPIYLFSSQALAIRDELGFDAARFGAMVSAFFVAGAVVSVAGGLLLDRIGGRTMTVIAGALALVGGLGVAALGTSYPRLFGLAALLGAAHACLQMVANTAVASAIPANRQGTAFAVKQAGGPAGIATAAVLAALVGQHVGWRPTFVIAAAMAAIVAAVVLMILPADGRATGERTAGPVPGPSPRMVIVASAGIGAASAAVTALGAFVVSWGVTVGLSPATAAYVLAAGSALSLIARVVTGARADRRGGQHFPVVVRQILVGAVAFAVLAVPGQVAFWPAAVLVFSIGWAWPGLFLFAMIRIAGDSPGVVAGATQAGFFVGGAAGPLLFGAVVSAAGYSAAWLVNAALMVAAAALLWRARTLFLRRVTAPAG